MIMHFSDFRRVDSFQRNLSSKSKVVRISAEFWTFFAPPPNFVGTGLPKVVHNLHYHACLAARHLEKFREVTPTSLKVLGEQTMNFKPNFKCSQLV